VLHLEILSPIITRAYDLLGGAFFSRHWWFYRGNQAQSDLNNPNRQVVVGDTYGYNYKYAATTLDALHNLNSAMIKLIFI
jgi:hypothetical protein